VLAAGVAGVCEVHHVLAQVVSADVLNGENTLGLKPCAKLAQLASVSVYGRGTEVARLAIEQECARFYDKVALGNESNPMLYFWLGHRSASRQPLRVVEGVECATTSGGLVAQEGFEPPTQGL
jgi:hypothetical protein